MTTERLINFEGVQNFRDLGGYPTRDGRHIRWRQLYRSAALQGITASDLKQFRALGVRSVIDLRHPSEVEHTGRGLLQNEALHFVNTSVLNNTALRRPRIDSPLPDNYLVTRYLEYFSVGAEALVSALKVLSIPENYPAIINCFFGKDRTGVLSALVLSLVGVEREDVIADYALSELSIPPIIAALSADPIYRETLEKTDPVLLSANAQTMDLFLVAFDERFGDVRQWARDTGISNDKINRLCESLLEELVVS